MTASTGVGPGRPNLPAEVKNARGTLRPGRDGDVIEVHLDALDTTPPADLGERGRDVWHRLTTGRAPWIKAPDYEALALAARLADLAAEAETRYRNDTDPKNARALLGFLTAFAVQLGRLGFDPAARSKLNIREVEGLSKLHRMMARGRTAGA